MQESFGVKEYLVKVKPRLPSSKKPTRVAAPSPRASLRRRTVCGRTGQRQPPVSKRYETKVRMVWGSFLTAAAALKTPTRNGSIVITPEAFNLTSRRFISGDGGNPNGVNEYLIKAKPRLTSH